ncbi:MAG: methyltransferase domain-containing protein [Candidatus Hydrogenedentes bacterium]|nr:methyltransferase domain-containing protein [Candidatus Hydrogenedentota bacterium]
MDDVHRLTVRELARQYSNAGDPLGCFEAIYSQAGGDAARVPWADQSPNPGLLQWLDSAQTDGAGRRALTIGCGLGDDAEELARRAFETTAFDISPTAIHWCRQRFPSSRVDYVAANLLDPPQSWMGAFHFVLESYTLQALPPDLRPRAMARAASFVAPGGALLVIARGREASDPEGHMPWPLTREELNEFLELGLRERGFDGYLDHESPPVRRFRVEYARP